MIIVIARKIAEYTAFVEHTTPSAPSTAMVPRIQNCTASAVEVWVSGSATRIGAATKVFTTPSGWDVVEIPVDCRA